MKAIGRDKLGRFLSKTRKVREEQQRTKAFLRRTTKVSPKRVVEKPVTKKPVSRKPVARKSVAKKPVSRKSVARKSVAKKPVARKAVAKKSVPRKPVAKKPVARKSVTKKPVPRKPVARKQVAKKPVAKKLVAKKAVPKKAVAKKPVAKKPVAKKPVGKKPVVKKPVPKKPAKRRKKIAKLPKRKVAVLPKKAVKPARKKKPKKRKKLPRLPPIDQRSRAAEVEIQRRMISLSQTIATLEPGLNMGIQSFINADGTVDGELRIANLPPEWREQSGLAELTAALSSAFLTFKVFDRHPPMGGSFWFSVAVRFGPQNEAEMSELAALYKQNKGLFQIGTYPTRADHATPLQLCLTDDRRGLRGMMEALAVKRGLPPTAVLIRFMWGPDWSPERGGLRPAHYKGEKGELSKK